MRSWVDGNLDWSIFGVVISIGVAIMLLMGLLAFVWEFDLAVSPAWQVGIFHLTLALLLSLILVVASRRPFNFSAGFRRFTLSMAVLVPMVVFGLSWVLIGPLEGFRDERIFTWVTVSVVGFMLVWLGAIFPYTAFVFGRALWRCRRGGIPYDGLRQ